MPGVVWSGYLTFGLVSIPVQLYPASRSTTIAFHLLHKDCGTRVKQRLVCPEHGALSRDEIMRGYEYEKNHYIEVEPEDIKKIEPATAQAMEIVAFVPQKDVDPLYFDASYYLVPGEPGRRAYALLHRALAGSRMYGIARVSMHNREYTVIIRALPGEGIAIHTMFYENEVRKIQELGQVNHGEVREKELQLANSLIESLAGKWEPGRFHDQFQANVQKMLEAKLEGRQVQEVEKPRMAPVVNLMAALKESLKKAERMPRKAVARAEAAHGSRPVGRPGAGRAEGPEPSATVRVVHRRAAGHGAHRGRNR